MNQSALDVGWVSTVDVHFAVGKGGDDGVVVAFERRVRDSRPHLVVPPNEIEVDGVNHVAIQFDSVAGQLLRRQTPNYARAPLDEDECVVKIGFGDRAIDVAPALPSKPRTPSSAPIKK